MEIMHHVGFSKQSGLESIANALGIRFKKFELPGEGNFGATFEIAETDRRWPRVSQLIKEKQLLDIAYTVFEQREILETDWVRFTPTNEKGYPQPKDRWEEITLKNGCPRCGVSSLQKAPYRIAKEPKTGRFDFLSLYWTYVMFTTPRVFTIFSREGFKGYEEWPVIIHRTGKPSEAIRQVYIPDETQPALVGADDLEQEVCPDCKQVTLYPVRRGPIRYHREGFPEGIDFVLSHEWFGGTGHQEIFISHRVAKVIIDNGWQGANLQPIELI